MPTSHQVEPGAALVSICPYCHPYHLKREIEHITKEHLRQEYALTSTSPFASPIILNHKKDDPYYMCVDYRGLNKITAKNPYPIPCIDDLLDEIHRAKYFPKIDLYSRHSQICIKEEDMYKITFHT